MTLWLVATYFEPPLCKAWWPRSNGNEDITF